MGRGSPKGAAVAGEAEAEERVTTFDARRRRRLAPGEEDATNPLTRALGVVSAVSAEGAAAIARMQN